MASGFAKLPGYCPTYPIDLQDYKRVSAKKQEENKDVKNKQPTLYPLPREQKKEDPDQKGMNNPNYMSTTHDVYRPKNVDHDIVDQFQPNYVKMDRHTLRFSGYFKETVVESKLESNRVRKLTLLYYLEDNSIQIIEPKLENSGIPQGAFLKRQKVLKADNSGYFIGLDDIKVGSDIMIFGKNIHISDCDEYTKEFFENLGKPQQGSEEIEKDQWTEKSINKPIPIKDHQMKDYIEHKLGGGKITSAKQFLENDRKVLKFYVISQIPYILHYYLADDTIEIREVHFQNDGRDPAPLMLRRQKLPQKFALNQPGQTYQEQFTRAEDIKYGSELNVYGRIFKIFGCDPFTKQYYQEKFNIDFPLGQIEDPKMQEYPQKDIPPYNGFGDEVDSLGYVYRLIPKAPNKDFFKWVDNQVFLRFVAKFNTEKPEDIERRFIITYFLNDDGLQVYEPQQRNSGIRDGKFLEKRQYKNVNNNNKIFQPTDLAVDSDILINGYSFHLIDCDDFTRKWFQNNLTILKEKK